MILTRRKLIGGMGLLFAASILILMLYGMLQTRISLAFVCGRSSMISDIGGGEPITNTCRRMHAEWHAEQDKKKGAP